MTNEPLNQILRSVAAEPDAAHDETQLKGIVAIAKLMAEEGLSMEQVVEYADCLAKGSRREDAMTFAKASHQEGSAQLFKFPANRTPS